MKKPLHEYSDDEIQKRLDFANLIMDSCEKHNKDRSLPDHLEQERRQLILEQERRINRGLDQIYIDKD